MPPQKKRSKAQYNPTAFTTTYLRKNTAYSAGRSIVSGTALLNAIIQPAAVFILMEDWNLLAKAIASLSIVLGWILFNQIGNAFFDIADANLETVKRDLAKDATTRTPSSLS